MDGRGNRDGFQLTAMCENACRVYRWRWPASKNQRHHRQLPEQSTWAPLLGHAYSNNNHKKGILRPTTHSLDSVACQRSYILSFLCGDVWVGSPSDFISCGRARERDRNINKININGMQCVCVCLTITSCLTCTRTYYVFYFFSRWTTELIYRCPSTAHSTYRRRHYCRRRLAYFVRFFFLCNCTLFRFVTTNLNGGVHSESQVCPHSVIHMHHAESANMQFVRLQLHSYAPSVPRKPSPLPTTTTSTCASHEQPASVFLFLLSIELNCHACECGWRISSAGSITEWKKMLRMNEKWKSLHIFAHSQLPSRESNGATELWKKKKKYFHRHWYCRRDGELMVFPRAYAQCTQHIHATDIIIIIFSSWNSHPDRCNRQTENAISVYVQQKWYVFRVPDFGRDRIQAHWLHTFSYIHICSPRCSQHKIAVLLDAAGLHGHVFTCELCGCDGICTIAATI